MKSKGLMYLGLVVVLLSLCSIVSATTTTTTTTSTTTTTLSTEVPDYIINDPEGDASAYPIENAPYVDITKCEIFIEDNIYTFSIQLVGNVDTENGQYIVWIDSDNNPTTGFIEQGGSEYSVRVDYAGLWGISAGVYKYIGSGLSQNIRDIDYDASDNVLTMIADLTSVDTCNANLWISTYGRGYSGSDTTDSIFVTSGCPTNETTTTTTSTTTTTIPAECTHNTTLTGFYTMTSDTTLCPDEAYSAQITIDADNVTLDCNDAILDGTIVIPKNWTCGGWHSTNPTTQGIYICNHSSIVIKNCKIVNYTGGISLTYSSFNSILNNTILSNPSNNGSGISIVESNQNEILDNEVYLNGVGISLGASSLNEINYNQIYSNRYGISLAFASENNTCLNNTIYDNELDGINIALFPSGNVVIGNMILNNSRNGIYIGWGRSNNISKNIIKWNVDGIHLAPPPHEGFIYSNENNSIEGNEILDNLGYGVYSGESKSIISDNNINFNNIGIFFNNSNSSVVVGNDVCSNSVLDFSLYQSYGNSGYANNCSNPDGWDDDGEEGCTYLCGATTTTTTTTTTTSTTSTTLFHPADTDHNGKIDDFELLNYIDLWVQGSVSDFDLLEAIDNWAKG